MLFLTLSFLRPLLFFCSPPPFSFFLSSPLLFPFPLLLSPPPYSLPSLIWHTLAHLPFPIKEERTFYDSEQPCHSSGAKSE